MVAHLIGVHLIGVHLIGVHFIGVHLIGVHLMGVYFIGVYLMGMHLIGVHLTGAYFMGVHLMGMRLTGVHLIAEIINSRSYLPRPVGPGRAWLGSVTGVARFHDRQRYGASSTITSRRPFTCQIIAVLSNSRGSAV
jgi:uncharacterized protein YjbI with pentapeptide repeats